MKNDVVFLPGICGKTQKKFYIRIDRGADDMWVRTYGITEIPCGETGVSENITVDLNNSRVGPQYKCPHCGSTYIFYCEGCGVKVCCYDGGNTWNCPIEGTSGIFSDDGIQSITGHGGKGQ